ncbi:MAG: hydroxymethylglutaryl-CoA lyase [Acidobacteriaceae bacterium]|jgi:hydroxymethylglutaryl-CoA lyase|nr:hydroxymethylglutaryl-CoA lyase [Acidobacteriaceae bacterium]
MSNIVKIIECPRDAWQGLPLTIPNEVKADYLRALVTAGFRHIDAVSFVSAKAVPQMADSEQVLALADLPSLTADELEVIGIVVNVKGAERAINSGGVNTLGFPYSISPGFLERNQHQTPEEAVDAMETLGSLAYKAGLNMVAYISMAFGNPYGDPWSVDEVVAACDLLADSGIECISLADTVGLATPQLIEEVVTAVVANTQEIELGVHLHARPDEAAAKIFAAYRAGCRRFDSALGGLGGCPFAQDVLVGNVPTETALAVLAGLGAQLPALQDLTPVLNANRAIAASYAGVKQ